MLRPPGPPDSRLLVFDSCFLATQPLGSILPLGKPDISVTLLDHPLLSCAAMQNRGPEPSQHKPGTLPSSRLVSGPPYHQAPACISPYESRVADNWDRFVELLDYFRPNSVPRIISRRSCATRGRCHWEKLLQMISGEGVDRVEHAVVA